MLLPAFGFRPQFLASIATFNGVDNAGLRLASNPNRVRVQVKIEEDQCANADQRHPMAESVSFWAMAEHGIVQATSLRQPSCEGVWDAAAADLIGATVDHLHSGHYGAGFVDFINPSGDSITWTVTPCAAGSYTLVFGYGLAGGDRPLEVLVNRHVVSSAGGLSFLATGAWTAWGENSLPGVPLVAGPNTVTITVSQLLVHSYSHSDLNLHSCDCVQYHSFESW